MFQKLDLKEQRRRSPGGGADADTLVYIGEPALPFGPDGLERLTPDQQGWLLEGFLCAQDIERFRLGQELHDSTGQLLVALRLGLAQVKAQGIVIASGELFREIDWTVEQIEKEMRAFSFLHYPTQLQDEGLAVALEQFVKGFGHRTGLRVAFRNQCNEQPGSGPAACALLRVAQEALTNVYRHAHATLVRVSIADRGGQVELCIEDNGEGLPETAAQCRSGVGLRSMNHRLESNGGKFLLKRLKRGTRVVATIPVDCFEGNPQ